MPLPRFDFAPHEWPPLGVGPREGVADAVFTVVWDGEEVEVAVREVAITPKSCLWFFKKTNADLKFVAGARGYEFPSPTASNLPEELKKNLIQEVLTLGGFSTAQQISLGADTEWLCLGVRSKRGSWGSFGSVRTTGAFALFVLSEGSIEEALDAPDSDTRFALRWSYLSADERLSKAIRFRNGDLKEIRSVVRAIGITEATRQNLPRGWTVVFADSLRFGENSLMALQQKNKIARLRRWSHHLNRYFNPRKDEELAARYLCVRYFAFGHYASFEEGPPSQHERLEAALFLREWATGKISPDELRLLLPKL